MASPLPVSSTAAVASGPEQRVRVRYASRLTASYRLLTGRKVRWTARVRDLSRSGMALILEHRFEVGLVLAIELEHRGQHLPHLFLVRVCHATPREDGRWNIGCQFAKELTEEEFSQLLY